MENVGLDFLKSAPERRTSRKNEPELARRIKHHKAARKFVLNYTPVIFVVILLIVAAAFVSGYYSWKHNSAASITSGISNSILNSDYATGQAYSNATNVKGCSTSTCKTCGSR